KLLAIPPGPTVLAGTNTTFVAAAAPLKASDAYRLMLTDEDKDFVAWVQTNLIDPFKTKEVTDLLAIDVETALQQAAASGMMMIAVINIRMALNNIMEPQTMDEWISRVKFLALIIDQER